MKSCQNSDCQMNGVPVEDAAVYFCEKCGSRLAESGEQQKVAESGGQPAPVTSVEQPKVVADYSGRKNGKGIVSPWVWFFLLCLFGLIKCIVSSV